MLLAPQLRQQERGMNSWITDEQKQLVRDSFAKVEGIAETAARLFYNRLFEIEPSLRPLFKGDMTEQGRKLMQMLAVCVKGLDNLPSLMSAVSALGRRHAGYGVSDANYDTVGAALLWTLEAGLGNGFTPAVREAWVEVYTILSTVMKQAATAAVA
jgi:hemoglobin-like flavoprotein